MSAEKIERIREQYDRRNRENRENKSRNSKLDEFPEDFDDVSFHNEAVDQERKIPVLRQIVYKKLKNEIVDRVASYEIGKFPLEDKFDVVLDISTYTEFQWAVIVEELSDRGFNVKVDLEDNKLKSITVEIERSISLTEPHKSTKTHECCYDNEE